MIEQKTIDKVLSELVSANTGGDPSYCMFTTMCEYPGGESIQICAHKESDSSYTIKDCGGTYTFFSESKRKLWLKMEWEDYGYYMDRNEMVMKGIPEEHLASEIAAMANEIARVTRKIMEL